MTLARIVEFGRTTPERIAMTIDGVPLTYSGFVRGITAARAFLMKQDLPAAGIIVTCISDVADAWSTILALHGLGYTTAAVGGLPELRHFAAEQVGCVIVRAGEPRPALADMAAKMGFRHFAMPAASGTAQDAPPPGASTGGHLVFTSGTTGVIKKVLIDTSNEDVHINQRLDAFAINPDSIVNVFDWARWSSVGYTVPLGVWSIGAHLIFTKTMKKDESLAHDGVTHVIATPDMVAELVKSPPGPRQNAFRLYVGGGPLPQPLADVAKRRITQQLHTMVGSTEAGVWCVTAIESPQDVTMHSIAPSRIVEIVDDEGQKLPAGETGEVRIGVLKNTTHYFDDADATQTFFRNGYFYPGDLGVFDTQGRLTLQGRVTDIVYTKGMKLAVAPLERKMQERLGAEELCIFSAQIGRLDEELWVIVKGKQKHDAATLNAIAQEELSRFSRIRYRFVAEFPKNDRGKVLRNDLKQMVLAAEASN